MHVFCNSLISLYEQYFIPIHYPQTMHNHLRMVQFIKKNMNSEFEGQDN